MTYLDKKIAVVTAITGGYDCLHKQMPNIEGIDYYCITDSDIKETNRWKIINDYKFPDYMNAKFKSFEIRYKLLSIFDNYDYVIWQDASIELNDNFIEIINDFIKNDYDFSVVMYGSRITYDFHLEMIEYTFGVAKDHHHMTFENNQITRWLKNKNWNLGVNSTINAALRIHKNNEKCKWFNQIIFNELVYLNQIYINDPTKYGQKWHNFYYDELVATYYTTLLNKNFKIYLMPISIYNSEYTIKYAHNSLTRPCGDYDKFYNRTEVAMENVNFNNIICKNSICI